jgi:3-oxoacyl-[acyl-carrier protein] reductase
MSCPNGFSAKAWTSLPASKSQSGKVALITGGSRGIGAAVARRFAAAGLYVAIGYQTRGDAAENLAADITRAGGQGLAVQGDITNADAAQRVVADTVARFGRIDILVNCAGIAPYRPLGAMDTAYIRSILDANVLGTILVTQAVLPHLPTPGGCIVNFASALAYRPIPASSLYAASKAAIATLTHAWSKELGPRGITVNAIAPGVIETEMTTGILAERGSAVVAATPLGRIGKTDDIAGIALFLCSSEAGWITGRTIIADGGVT